MARVIQSRPQTDLLGGVRELQRISELAFQSEAGLDLYLQGQRGQAIESMVREATQFLELVTRDLKTYRESEEFSVKHGPRNYRATDIPLLRQRGQARPESRTLQRLEARVRGALTVLEGHAQGNPMPPTDTRRCLQLIRHLGEKYVRVAMRSLDEYKRMRRGIRFGYQTASQESPVSRRTGQTV